MTAAGGAARSVDVAVIGDGPAGRNSGFMIDLPHDLASDDYGGAVEADTATTAVADTTDTTTVTLTADPNVDEGGNITYTATVDNAPQGSDLVIDLDNGDGGGRGGGQQLRTGLHAGPEPAGGLAGCCRRGGRVGLRRRRGPVAQRRPRLQHRGRPGGGHRRAG